MNIYYDIDEIVKDNNTTVTIGTFDGFHRGHQNIIDLLVNHVRLFGGRSLLITFEPHPRSVLSKDFQLKLLTTPEEKLKLIENSGVQNVLVMKFNHEFSELTYEEFVKNLIIGKIGIKELIMGHDHCLGKDRGGDENRIMLLGRKFGFSVQPVPAVRILDEVVSSTKIRQALLSGDIEKANNFLGCCYSFSGNVVHGAERGRTLGFPTANIELNDKNKIIPANGVYFVEAEVAGSKHYGIMNIGIRPTFSDVAGVMIEIHILNFDKDIYTQNFRVNIIRKIRDEIKFSSVDRLIEQINSDKQTAFEIINKITN
ncbi:MAG: bifunctional riboflavin kinase/FAD synthetase [Ignavibacteria bacterium]